MKIDITKLEGYKDDMTAEEKLALYEAYEIAEPSYDGYIKKDTFDKTASELAQLKKQMKEKMTEDEKKKADEDEKTAKIMEELEALRRDKAISDTKAQYLALGYDEKLAADTAEAFANGETDKVFANHKKFIEGKEKAIKAEVLGQTPRPPAGEGAETPMTKEKFLSMTTQEQIQYKQENANWQELK